MEDIAQFSGAPICAVWNGKRQVTTPAAAAPTNDGDAAQNFDATERAFPSHIRDLASPSPVLLVARGVEIMNNPGSRVPIFVLGRPPAPSRFSHDAISILRGLGHAGRYSIHAALFDDEKMPHFAAAPRWGSAAEVEVKRAHDEDFSRVSLPSVTPQGPDEPPSMAPGVEEF
ncbi:hypothetical protein S40293_10619 [Stachybotrys chartarum IBT 40293]|nr:hypothetical protein S40293_10619 [Stachybotrys chartarum IBT 40293]KFA78044.1 hypothetical protein S40288_11267 [Stachybotrys chartarum IBT 40288]